MKPYRQADIWRYLRRNPGSRVRDIAAAVKGPNNSVTHSLKRMRDAGIVRNEGVTHKSVWFVCGPKPECHWGLAVNSLANLKHSQARWRELLRLALLAKGVDVDNPKPRRVQKQHNKHALDECWGLYRGQND